MPLSAFESEVLYLRNLIDAFVISRNGATLLSSIGTVGQWHKVHGDVTVLETTTTHHNGERQDHVFSLATAEETGYSEAKMVCEQLIHATCRDQGVRGSIYRLTQLSGASEEIGIALWDHREWFPTVSIPSRIQRSQLNVPSCFAFLVKWNASQIHSGTRMI